MKILQIHNKYLLPGGEDAVLQNESELLRQKGNHVFLFEKDNKEIKDYSFNQKISLLWKTAWSPSTVREAGEIIKSIKPDICHIHNFFPLISPSVFSVCKDHNIPVVQTLHNYRLLCANAYLFRENQICEKCLSKGKYHSILNKCYHDSYIQSLSVYGMQIYNELINTWKSKIDLYICLTAFSKNIFVKGGFPENKIAIKPNFLSYDPGSYSQEDDCFLFFGRLDITKGVKVLIESIKSLPEIKMKMAGDGPLKSELVKWTGDNIEYLGLQNKEGIINLIKKSVAVIFPSLWYEGLPMSIIEAFACGKAVIASNIGAMAEIIEDGKNGLLFEAGNSVDLAAKMKWANIHRDEMKKMGLYARKTFEEKYTADINYNILINLYQSLIDKKS